MLFHSMADLRSWTVTFFGVLLTSRYLERLDDPKVTLSLATHLYNSRDRTEQHADHSENYFHLLVELFNEISANPNVIMAHERLAESVKWLEERVIQKEANDVLLKGQLDLAAILVRSIPPSELENVSPGLIKLLNEIIFPSSPNERRSNSNSMNNLVDYDSSPAAKRSNSVPEIAPISPRKLGSPLCDTPQTVNSAMNLLVELTKGSVNNLKQLRLILTQNWHNQANLNNYFDHYPSSQKRSKTGYVGLKNGGATCYLNAVSQQLFMIPRLRDAILSAQLTDPSQRIDADKNTVDKNYRFKIFNNFQRLVGHLASSEQTFFTPREFWDHLKLCGELINVRDQQDAMEYYSQIVDTLHEVRVLNIVIFCLIS